MHGDPGSGKSTLARALGRTLPAVVIDKDVIASADSLKAVPDRRGSVGRRRTRSCTPRREAAARATATRLCSTALASGRSSRRRRDASRAAPGATWCMVEHLRCSDELRDGASPRGRALESNPRSVDRGPDAARDCISRSANAGAGYGAAVQRSLTSRHGTCMPVAERAPAARLGPAARENRGWSGHR